MRDDFPDYLKRLDRLEEPGLAFGPRINVDKVRVAMESAFAGRHVFTLRASGPVPPQPKEIEESFRNSFDGRGVLAVVVDSRIPAPLMKAIEQMCEDRAFYQQLPDGSWGRLVPPADWRMLVLVESPDLQSVPPSLTALFASPFAL